MIYPKGVVANNGRYIAKCITPPCHGNNLGAFDTPEDAAQAYLQHQQLRSTCSTSSKSTSMRLS